MEFITLKDHSNYNCIITTDTGDVHRVYANWLHNNDLDHWKGWSCDAGNTRFYIDKNFDIWSGLCQNDYLGNALTEWSTKSNTICQQNTCNGCTDDLITKKEKRD